MDQATLRRSTRNEDVTVLIGNALDHFDTSLYGFLAPVLAPIFFATSKNDEVMGLIMAYGALGTSVVTRPLGAVFFGTLAKRVSPVFALRLSLFGVGVCSLCMGFLPGFQYLGYFAPALLYVLRGILGIFAAGEASVSQRYMLEGKVDKSAMKTSYLFQFSTMIGIILASGFAAIVIKYHSDFPSLWRYLFVFGSLVSFFGFYLRLDANERGFSECGFEQTRIKNFGRWSLGAFLAGFSYLTYAVPFLLMNSLVPLLSKWDAEAMMEINTLLLIFDAALIVPLGHLCSRFSPRRTMLVSSLILGVSFPPLFYFLHDASLWYIIFVRGWVVFWGVIFMIPLGVWFQKNLGYISTGITAALGSSLIGRFCPSISLFLFSYGGHAVWVGVYLGLISLIVFFALKKRNPILT